ncbi:Ig-like domain-containing protein [Vibrio vulnificus]
MMSKLTKTIFAVMLCSVIIGCGEDSTIKRNDAVQFRSYDVIDFSQGRKEEVIDLMSYLPLDVTQHKTLTQVVSKTNSDQCEVLSVDSQKQRFVAVSSEICEYSYILEGQQEQQYGNIIILPTYTTGVLESGWLPSIRLNSTLSTGLNSNKIYLSSELEKYIDLDNYKADDEFRFFGNGELEFDNSNDLTELLHKYQEPGISKLIYRIYDVVTHSYRYGVVEMVVSEGDVKEIVAEDGVYQDVLFSNTNYEIDVSTFVKNESNSDYQLVYVSSQTALVESSEPDNINNKKFKFTTPKVGENIVSYGISDHRGNFSVGTIIVNVAKYEMTAPWSDVVDGVHYLAPLTEFEALSANIDMDGSNFDFNKRYDAPISVAIFNLDSFEKNCSNIPSVDNMISLSNNDMDSKRHWPQDVPYWAYDSVGDVFKGVDLKTAEVVDVGIDSKLYATCIKSTLSDISHTVHNDGAIADGNEKISIDVLFKTVGGEPITNQTVIARFLSGYGELDSSMLSTDNDGRVVFSISSLISGDTVVNIGSATLGYINVDLNFVPDLENAVIEVVNKGFNTGLSYPSLNMDYSVKVRLRVSDVNGNPIPNVEVLARVISGDKGIVTARPTSTTDDNGIILFGLGGYNPVTVEYEFSYKNAMHREEVTFEVERKAEFDDLVFSHPFHSDIYNFFGGGASSVRTVEASQTRWWTGRPKFVISSVFEGVNSYCSTIPEKVYADGKPWRALSAKELERYINVVSQSDVMKYASANGPTFDTSIPAKMIAMISGSKDGSNVVMIPSFNSSAFNTRQSTTLARGFIVCGYTTTQTPVQMPDLGLEILHVPEEHQALENLKNSLNPPAYVVGTGSGDKSTLGQKYVWFEWDEAMRYCEEIEVDGKSDWRVAKFEELRQIYTTFGESSKLYLEKNIYSAKSVFSSDENSATHVRGWQTPTGAENNLPKTSHESVVCVRDM